MRRRHMTTSTWMCHRTTGNSSLAVHMRIAAIVKVATTGIVAAIQNHIRSRDHGAPVVTAATDGHNASRGDHQRRDSQSKCDPVRQSVRLVHTDLPFADGIKQSAGSRNTTNRVWIINRTILAPWVAPQVWRADMIKSPNVKSNFGFIFIRSKLIPYDSFRNGVFSPGAGGHSFAAWLLSDPHWRPATQPGCCRRLHQWLLPCRGHPAVRLVLPRA